MESKVMTSFAEIKSELFAVIVETEERLNEFLDNRKNSIALQIAIEKIQQIYGILNLIEHHAAQLLAKEILTCLMDVPTGFGNQKKRIAQTDKVLMSVVGGLYTLHRYLENFGYYPSKIPELLLPAINQLRRDSGKKIVNLSAFAKIELKPRPQFSLPELDAVKRGKLVRQMCQMLQVGLVSVLQNRNLGAGVKLMKRAVTALDKLLAKLPGSNMLWIGAALLEVYQDGGLTLTQERKRTFMQLHRELNKMLKNGDYQADILFLKDMIYLIGLGNTDGPLVRELQKTITLPKCNFTDKELQLEQQKLTGPSLEALNSFSIALREEIYEIQDSLDLIWRGTVKPNVYIELHKQLIKIIKVLGIIGLDAAVNTLKKQLAVIKKWSAGAEQNTSDLNAMADAIIIVESQVYNLGKGNMVDKNNLDEARHNFAQTQFNAAHVLIIDELIASIESVKEAINDCINSDKVKKPLHELPSLLSSVGGALLFLGRVDAAKIAIATGNFIDQLMQNPAEDYVSAEVLEILVNIFSSMEYYIEQLEILDEHGLQNIIENAIANTHQLRGLVVTV